MEEEISSMLYSEGMPIRRGRLKAGFDLGSLSRVDEGSEVGSGGS